MSPSTILSSLMNMSRAHRRTLPTDERTLFRCMMPWPAHKIEKLNDGGQSSFFY
jgi:hypothetical protein